MDLDSTDVPSASSCPRPVDTVGRKKIPAMTVSTSRILPNASTERNRRWRVKQKLALSHAKERLENNQPLSKEDEVLFKRHEEGKKKQAEYQRNYRARQKETEDDEPLASSKFQSNLVYPAVPLEECPSLRRKKKRREEITSTQERHQEGQMELPFIPFHVLVPEEPQRSIANEQATLACEHEDEINRLKSQLTIANKQATLVHEREDEINQLKSQLTQATLEIKNLKSQLTIAQKAEPDTQQWNDGAGVESQIMCSERSLKTPEQSAIEEGKTTHKCKTRNDSEPIPSAPSKRDEVILTYSDGFPGTLLITNADLERLNSERFLNDNLIEFGLRVLLSGLRTSSPELFNQIHVFTSFFYEKLTHSTHTNFIQAYKSVSTWTKNVDIFRKKYVFVPIHEGLHWYLAIIYKPKLAQNPGTESGINMVPETYIFTLDSLGGRHDETIKNLSAYLEMEAKGKKCVNAVGKVEGKLVPVPIQTNRVDCGIYLLHFVRIVINSPNVLVCHTTPFDALRGSKELNSIWHVDDLQGRQQLSLQIEALSKDWKAGNRSVEVMPSSEDDEVEFL